MRAQGQEGLLDTWRRGWRSRGTGGLAVAVALVSSYCALYFGGDTLLGVPVPDVVSPLARQVAALTGLSWFDKWFLYGALYSLAMAVGSASYLRKHGNSRYNRARIAVNVGVQIVLAFALPAVMQAFTGKQFYLSYIWPLKFEYFDPRTLAQYPAVLAIYSVLASLVLAPLLTWRFGKRWYCSWVCGCGGLANTFGDPWRHLTSKSAASWRFERWSIHTVLGVALVATVIVIANWAVGDRHPAFASFAFGVQGAYGFFVGAVLAGVVGTGLYPVLGPRVWCRNFCPMAAYLGLVQRFSGWFRIRVKPGMCISCGNCTTYCEMGIDVRAYAEQDQSFVRASCVGCGMCAHVCPRGVLRLEATGDGRMGVVLDL